jgi:hypothetical protein
MKQTRWSRMAEVVDLNQRRTRPKAAPPVAACEPQALGLAFRVDLATEALGLTEKERALCQMLLSLPGGTPIPKRYMRELHTLIGDMLEEDFVSCLIEVPQLDDAELVQVK